MTVIRTKWTVSLAVAALVVTGAATTARAQEPGTKPLPPIPVAPSVGPYTIVRTANVVIRPGDRLDAFAQCPDGTKPLSGGEANTAGDGSVVLDESFPKTNSWGVTVRNIGAVDQQFLTFAVCGSIQGYAALQSDRFPIPPNGADLGVRACPAQSPLVVGGGHLLPDTDNQPVVSSFPLTSEFWAVEVANPHPVEVSLYVRAVCGHSIPGYEIARSGDTILEPHELLDATVTCPDGKSVIGGGAQVEQNGATITDTYPLDSTRWEVYLKNRTGERQTFRLYAVCGS